VTNSPSVTDRELCDLLARLDRASAALYDTLGMLSDDDSSSADIVIAHNVDFARIALDAAVSFLADLRENRRAP